MFTRLTVCQSLNLIFLSFIFYSCNSSILETPVQLPKSIEQVKGFEVNSVSLDSLQGTKLLFYFDSLECSSCALKLIETSFHNLSNFYSDFVIILSPEINSIKHIERLIALYDFPYPIYIDKGKEFQRRNAKLLKRRSFHFLVLDNEKYPIAHNNPMIINDTNLFLSILNDVYVKSP